MGYKMKSCEKKPLALIGEKADEKIINSLTENGFEALTLPADYRLALPVAHHADMLMLRINDTVFCNKEYFDANNSIFARISEYGYTVCPESFEVSNKYPYDIALNQAVISKNIIGKADSCAECVLNYAKKQGYVYHSTNQGYAKCSVLILGDKAVISADDGILMIAKGLGLDTLKIENGIGEIFIDGYDYGFIGGVSAVYGDKVFFFGSLESHSQRNKITKFCAEHGFSVIELSNSPLCDLGGAIILPYIKS